MHAHRVLLVFTLLAACSSGGDAPIDRTGFDLGACPAGASSPFGGLTPSTPVDYLELREESQRLASRGTLCASATDASACQQSVAGAMANGWSSRPAGGIPAPTDFLVFVRGDTVGTVGASDLAAFLAPIDNASDAAFLAQVVTLGVAGCTPAAVRTVDGGYEVITTTSQTCGGGQTQQRVFVARDGTTAVRETRTLSEGEDIVCP